MDFRSLPNLVFWSPNIRSFFPTGFSFKRRWRELDNPYADHNQGTQKIPPELFSCYLEARAGHGAQFDASSYSSGTLSSGVSSWRDGPYRSFSSDSSRSRNRSSSNSRSRGNSRYRSSDEDEEKASPYRAFYRWRRRRSRARAERHRSADSAITKNRRKRSAQSEEDQRKSRPREKTKRSSVRRGLGGQGGTARVQSLGRLATTKDTIESQPKPPLRRKKKPAAYKNVRVIVKKRERPVSETSDK